MAFCFIVVILFFNGLNYENTAHAEYKLKALAKKSYFVDKSHVIKSFFSAPNVVMLAAPRRFGKTLNMEMIKIFCEKIIQKNGTALKATATSNYDFFKENNLTIFNDKEFFEEYFGQNPVIFLDFERLDCTSYVSFVKSFSVMIKDMYNAHRYMLYNDNLGTFKFRTYFLKGNNLEKVDLIRSVTKLSFLLYSYFKRKIVLLVDGYDHLVNRFIFNTDFNVGIEFNNMITFIFEFLSHAVFSNLYVVRCMINAEVLIGPALPLQTKYIQRIPFLSDRLFSTSYGFTEKEVEELLARHKLQHRFSSVARWYGGYRLQKRDPNYRSESSDLFEPKDFSDTDDLSGISDTVVFNPYSVVKFLTSKMIKKFWTKFDKTKEKTGILVSEKCREIFDLLLTYNFTRIRYRKRMTVNHVVKLRKIFTRYEEYFPTRSDVSLFLQLLTDLGYLNIVHHVSRFDVRLDIPNLETKSLIQSMIPKRRRRRNKAIGK